MCFFHKLPDPKEEADKAFFKQLEESSRSQLPVLMGDLYYSNICWSVLGLARTGLIFTGIQEGAQPGGGG